MKNGLVAAFEVQKVIPVIRANSLGEARQIVTALYAGGVRVMELTTTIPDVYALVGEVRVQRPDILVGLGTVCDRGMADQAVDSGADFLVTYKVSEAVADVGQRRRVPYVLGAATPTEVDRCMELDSAVVKIFPARIVGPNFIREIRGPIPEVRCFPTGGIGLDDIDKWLGAGSVAVGIGGALIRLGSTNSDYSVVVQRADSLLNQLGVDVEALTQVAARGRSS